MAFLRSSLLIVPRNTVSNASNVIVRVNRQNKIDRDIQQEGLDVANIVLNKRRRDTLLNTLDNNVEKPLPVINAPKKIIKSISKSISKTQRIPSRPQQVPSTRKILNAIPIVYPAIDINL